MIPRPSLARHPVVLRMQGMFPNRISNYEAHRLRARGDLGHVRGELSAKNKLLIGDDDWAAKALSEIAAMRIGNFADELEGLQRRKRRKEVERRLAEGPKDPWRPTQHGPLREVILTANKDWFAQVGIHGDVVGTDAQATAFEERAVAWLKANFGEDVVHARADVDEAAYHIHAVIVPRAEKTVNGATRKMLEPSKHPLIKHYEKAQDSVGEWFSEIGLTRGERRAAAIRDARAKGETPPPKRRHTRPWDWRMQEELRLISSGAALEAREDELARREAQADRQAETTTRVRAAVETRAVALTAREAQVETRERAADDRKANAEAVLAVASGLSNGAFEVEAEGAEAPFRIAAGHEAQANAKPLMPRIEKRPKAAALAGRLFQRAFSRLREKAVAAAEAQLARDFAEIRAADDAIVEIAAVLPADQRSKIHHLRKGLVRRIMALGRSIGAEKAGGKDREKHER